MSVLTTESNDNYLESGNLLILLFKWRKTLIILCIAAAFISAAASYALKEKYKSVVTMYAEQQHSFGAQLVEVTKTHDVLEYGGEGELEKLMQLLNSDRVRQMVVNKYDLWSVYKIDKASKSANAFLNTEYANNVIPMLTKYGALEVTVYDEDPVRAANMANSIAMFADTVSNQMRRDRAMLAFQYADSSFNNLKTEVKMMEDSMNLLMNMGIYSYKDQVAELTEQYGLAIANGFPERAKVLKDELTFIGKYGTTFTQLYLRLDESYNRMGLMKKRYDLMRIDVDSDIPCMRILDWASVADKKSYPIRWLIVALSVASAFVFGIITLLIINNLKRLRLDGRI